MACPAHPRTDRTTEKETLGLPLHRKSTSSSTCCPLSDTTLKSAAHAFSIGHEGQQKHWADKGSQGGGGSIMGLVRAHRGGQHQGGRLVRAAKGTAARVAMRALVRTGGGLQQGAEEQEASDWQLLGCAG